HVTGIDSSAEMIESAKQKYPLGSFRIASVTSLPFSKNFDAIFSNAVLHWVLEKEKAAEQMYQALKNSGRLVVEFGGRGNISHIVEALKKTLEKYGFSELAKKEIWYFPSIGEYTSLLEKQGFRVLVATHFDRDTLLKDDRGIKNWLRMFAGPFLEGLDSRQEEMILNDVEQQLKPTNFHNGLWYADYKRLRIEAVKEKD
ncbi:MAG TPA: methyltransferase domain-containing protein, partial [Hanamia sp.]|nr:methyltransferase domain-containing protein [Hanamia sp.]